MVEIAKERDMAKITALAQAAKSKEENSHVEFRERERLELLHLLRLGSVYVLREDESISGFLAYSDCRRWPELPRAHVHLLYLLASPELEDEEKETRVLRELHDHLVNECQRHGVQRLSSASRREDFRTKEKLVSLSYQNCYRPELSQRFPRQLHFCFPLDEAGMRVESQILLMEDSLPRRDKQARLHFAKERELSLEVSYASWQSKGYIPLYEEFEVPTPSVAAIGMTEHHFLHESLYHRDEAQRLLSGALDMAERLSAKRVAVFIAESDDIADRPFERALEFFAPFVDEARSRELIMDITARPSKGPHSFGSPEDIQSVLAALDGEGVIALRLDGSQRLAGNLQEHFHSLDVLQLELSSFYEKGSDLELPPSLQPLLARASTIVLDCSKIEEQELENRVKDLSKYS
mgnify:FL=1